MKSARPEVHRRFDAHFKAMAVRLSDLPDVLVQDVAEALDIHPFMLSRWRKQAREGRIVTKGVKLDTETAAELKRLRELEKKYKQPCLKSSAGLQGELFLTMALRMVSSLRMQATRATLAGLPLARKRS